MGGQVWSPGNSRRRRVSSRFAIAQVVFHIFLPYRAALVRRAALQPQRAQRAGPKGPGRKMVGFMSLLVTLLALAVVALLVLVVISSIKSIGPTEVGLVTKRVGFGKLGEENAIAFHGEAGYQAKLLKPGLRFKLWPIYGVKKFPWVQVPAGEIGVVIAQVGAQLPVGAKSAAYKPEFGNFADLDTFISGGGQKGVQRLVLPPGTLLPMHPVAFMVLTSRKIYGLTVSPDLVARVRGSGGVLQPQTFGLVPEQLQVVVIAPDGPQDVVGIV